MRALSLVTPRSSAGGMPPVRAHWLGAVPPGGRMRGNVSGPRRRPGAAIVGVRCAHVTGASRPEAADWYSAAVIRATASPSQPEGSGGSPIIAARENASA